ncbi:MAG: hypothetical protein JZU65_10775 [Chlorobium sp.]|nr:hypothetical protein [Chlorobium sp.]
METSQLDLDQATQETIQRLKHALIRQVPEMTRGFTIHTNYGDIEIDTEFAEQFRILADVVLQRQLKRLITY